MPKLTTRDNIEIYYEDFGNGDQPLIFIHPPLMGHVVFKYQRMLSEDFRIILYDMRGHGRSTQQVEDSTLQAHTRDLVELIDHIGNPKVILIGYSVASMLALRYALDHPEKVAGLIMPGAFPKATTWLLKQQFHAGISLMRFGQKDLLSKVLAFSHRMNQKDFEELYDYGTKVYPPAVKELYEEYLNYDCTERLPELANIPILIIYGTLSRHIRAHHRIFQKYLPSAKIAFVEKSFHQLPTRSHLPLNHLIHRFLQQK